MQSEAAFFMKPAAAGDSAAMLLLAEWHPERGEPDVAICRMAALNANTLPTAAEMIRQSFTRLGRVLVPMVESIARDFPDFVEIHRLAMSGRPKKRKKGKQK